MTASTLDTLPTLARARADTAIALASVPQPQAGAIREVLEDASATVTCDVALDGRPLSVADVAADAVVVFGAGSRSATTRSVKQVKDARPDLPVIVVLPDGRAAHARTALRAGAAAIVFEQQLRDMLPISLDATLAGMLCVPQALRHHVERHALSSREKQVLALVVMGYGNAEIAAQLFLAESTVKTHLSSIFAKLDVNSRHEAAALVLDPDEGIGIGVLALSDAPDDSAQAETA